MTPDICAPVHKSNESEALAKLARMLRSMLRRFPNTYLYSTKGAFGVSLGEHGYLRIAYSGSWSADSLRDYLALFVTLLAVDPSAIVHEGENLSAHNGVSSKDHAP